ncbi:hypothetical protein V1477_007038 [Vespula maculifrons]|uniref:Uncharacterized protein n=1 Tax=Vespula maculifrons TaxID=7453 RepID=A0ABD2CHK3_VESMC
MTLSHKTKDVLEIREFYFECIKLGTTRHIQAESIIMYILLRDRWIIATRVTFRGKPLQCEHEVTKEEEGRSDSESRVNRNTLYYEVNGKVRNCRSHDGNFPKRKDTRDAGFNPASVHCRG